jgi:surface protein
MAIEMHVLTNPYNGHRLVRYVNVPDPLGELTIRVRYKPGKSPSISGATITAVTGMEDVYDVCTAGEGNNGTSWYQLFQYQKNLLEVIAANATGVTYTNYMFSGCSSLTSVAGFDTSSVTRADGMFSACRALTSIGSFDFSSVTNADYIFSACESLTAIPVLNFASCTTLAQAFRGCNLITSVSLLNTGNVVSFYQAFQNCIALIEVPLLNTSKASQVSSMFSGCTNVESGALALYNQMSSQTTPPAQHSSTFYNCGSNTVTGAAELAQIPSDWK